MGPALSGRPHSSTLSTSPMPVTGTAPPIPISVAARPARPPCKAPGRWRGIDPKAASLTVNTWPLAESPLFRAPHGLPARSPPAPRATLGASSRSPARPYRPCGALHKGDACSVRCSGPPLTALLSARIRNEAATGFPATASSMNERQREISATSTRAVTAATHTIAILRPTARISSRSISYSTSNDGGFRLASISNFTRSPPRNPTGSGLALAFPRASSCP